LATYPSLAAAGRRLPPLAQGAERWVGIAHLQKYIGPGERLREPHAYHHKMPGVGPRFNTLNYVSSVSAYPPLAYVDLASTSVALQRRTKWRR
jgi:hypothetical protein